VLQFFLALTAASTAVSDVCKVLMSPEGQLTLKQMRDDRAEAKRIVNAIGAWFDKTFQIQFAINANQSGATFDLKAAGENK
jgi:hypothetical protein